MDPVWCKKKKKTNRPMLSNNNCSVIAKECQDVSQKGFSGLVCCGLTLHSLIFQLYSKRTCVRFTNLELLPGTQRNGELGVFNKSIITWRGYQDIRRRVQSSTIRGPIRGKGITGFKPDPESQSSLLPLRHQGGRLKRERNTKKSTPYIFWVMRQCTRRLYLMSSRNLILRMKVQNSIYFSQHVCWQKSYI